MVEVKFVSHEKYGMSVYNYAPKLNKVEKVCDVWSALIMEYIDGSTRFHVMQNSMDQSLKGRAILEILQ